MALTENEMPIIAEYCSLVAKKKELEARIKAMDSEVRPLLEDKGNVLVDGMYTAELKVMKGRRSLDKKAVEASGINLEPFYNVGAPFTTLTVKVLG